MSIDPLGVGAVLLVSAEWLGLGWLSGVRFPQPGRGATTASWALRLLVGTVLVSSAQLLLAVIGVGFGSILIALGLSAVGALVLRVVGGIRRASDPELKAVPVERRETLGWVLLGLVLFGAVVRAFLVPEAGWDAFSHWGLRAQAFAFAGTIVNAHSEHEYYPPLVPLLEAWLEVHRGLVSIDLAKTIWAIVGSAFAICLGWFLRANLRSVWLAPYLALGIVLGTTALLEGFWTGQADLALTAYLSLATLAVWQWQLQPNRAWLIVAGVFAAGAALTKFEGVPRVGVLELIVLIEGLLSRPCRVWAPLLSLAAPAIAAVLIWTAFELTHGITPNAEHVGALQLLGIGSVLAALLGVFGGLRTGGGLLVVALAWLVSARSLWSPALRLLVLVVVAQALATLVAFLLSSTSPELEVTTSATRLVEQFLPIALFVGALGLAAQATYNRGGR